jgi:hypothetical protein
MMQIENMKTGPSRIVYTFTTYEQWKNEKKKFLQ